MYLCHVVVDDDDDDDDNDDDDDDVFYNKINICSSGYHTSKQRLHHSGCWLLFVVYYIVQLWFCSFVSIPMDHLLKLFDTD